MPSSRSASARYRGRSSRVLPVRADGTAFGATASRAVARSAPRRYVMRAMTDFGIDVERSDDGIAWIILRNPSRMNAVRLEMWQALPEAVATLGADASVRVIVLRGHGSQAFASGADISEFETHRADPESAKAYEAT